MQEKYEQAIKESFDYLEECITSAPKQKTMEYLYNLGIDRAYIVQRQMELRGFEVIVDRSYDQSELIVYPKQHNLPIHIWRNKDVY